MEIRNYFVVQKSVPLVLIHHFLHFYLYSMEIQNYGIHSSDTVFFTDSTFSALLILLNGDSELSIVQT